MLSVNCRRGILLLGTLLCFVVPLVADQNPPELYFLGHRLHIGMSKQEAVAQLDECCSLSPDANANIEQKPHPANILVGHFIRPKTGVPLILGSISFSTSGKVVRLSKPLDDEIDSSSEDLVGFIRALRNAIDSGESGVPKPLMVSVEHENITNASSQIIRFRFLNGREIEIHVGALDKSNPDTGKRDFATMDEVLE
jgi:hypothetical protein